MLRKYHPSKTTDVKYENDTMNLSVFIVSVDCICMSIDTSTECLTMNKNLCFPHLSCDSVAAGIFSPVSDDVASQMAWEFPTMYRQCDPY